LAGVWASDELLANVASRPNAGLLAGVWASDELLANVASRPNAGLLAGVWASDELLANVASRPNAGLLATENRAGVVPVPSRWKPAMVIGRAAWLDQIFRSGLAGWRDGALAVCSPVTCCEFRAVVYLTPRREAARARLLAADWFLGMFFPSSGRPHASAPGSGQNNSGTRACEGTLADDRPRRRERSRGTSERRARPAVDTNNTSAKSKK
jgi:hypothetical protein